MNVREMDLHSREELANAITHGAGAAVAAIGGAALITIAALRGDAWQIVGVSVFVATLVTLYLASTLYHAARDERTKARLMVFDHAAIYLLIAGTYTPFTIGALRGGWGWSLFGVIWGLALCGVAFKLRFQGRYSLASTAFYVAMGWLMIIAVVPLVRVLDGATLAWLVAGGIAYTLGAPFYQWARFRYSHALWHLFVISGSVCHAVAIALT